MESHLVMPGESVEDLGCNGLRVIQGADGFRFSIDAVLLARFATVRNYNRVVDLATGTAIVPLLLSCRAKSLRLFGVELHAKVADRATRSVKLNCLDHMMTIVNGDVRDIKNILPHGSFDLVTANPPYMPLHQGEMSADDENRMARHEVSLNLQDVVSAASWLLPTGGRFAMVHRPERLTEIMVILRSARLEPKRLQIAYPKQGKNAVLLLVEAVRDAKPALQIAPPLYLS